MAYVKMDDFLKKYFKQLHFNSMPTDVRTQFLSDLKNGLLTPQQEQWVKDYMVFDNNKKAYVENDLPDPSKNDDLAEEEAKKLFSAFQIAFAGMQGAKHSYDKVKDAEVLAFLSRWFGEGRPFNVPKATQECKDGITDIVTLLKKDNRVAQQLKDYIVRNTIKDDKPVFDPPTKLDELLDKCKDDKYNTDKSVQDKIKAVAHILRDYLGAHYTEPSPDHPEYNMYKATLGISESIEAVTNPDAFSVSDISDEKLKEFREDYAPELLQELYYNKDLRAAFSKHDVKKVTEQIDKAEGKVSWHNKESEDYVQPKIADVLNPVQQIEKWAADTYNDTLKKYEELRGGHLFFTAHAKEICKAIDKEKIKPADGLNGLLDKADAIKKRIGNTAVGKHFDWFVQTLNKIKDKIPKAIEGCWRNAEQMKCVVGQIILAATDPNDKANAEDNFEKAKTALEIMTVMKYGMLTSRVMDALKQTDFTMFSDGKLSWNKNEGIQFVTKAFDQSVKAAFLGVGYGITFIRNKIMMSGMRFTNKNNQDKAFKERIGELNSDLDRDKKGGIRDLDTQIQNKQTELQGHKDAIAAVKSSGGIKKLEGQKSNYEKQLQPFIDAKNKASADMDTYQKAKASADKIRQKSQSGKEAYEQCQYIISGQDIKDKQAEIQNQRKTIADDIKEITDQLNSKTLKTRNGTPITNSEAKKAYRSQLASDLIRLQNEDKELQKQYDQEEARKKSPEHLAEIAAAKAELKEHQDDYDAYKDADKAYNDADKKYQDAENIYKDADKKYQDLATSLNYEDLSDKISKYHDATENMKEVNQTIEEYKKAKANWDKEHDNKFIALENFWNWLQTGDTKTWALSLSHAQDRFDSKDSNGNIKKDLLFQQFLNSRRALTP